jgi:hypothetical protein
MAQITTGGGLFDYSTLIATDSCLLLKRKKNVSIEMNLHVLAYNLKRMMTIMGTTGLMEAIRQ